MAYTSHEGRTSQRGFASMNAERQRQIASMGGKAVPDEKRSFSQNRRLAAEAGRKGGQSVPGAKRSFSQNRELAAQAAMQARAFRGDPTFQHKMIKRLMRATGPFIPRVTAIDRRGRILAFRLR